MHTRKLSTFKQMKTPDTSAVSCTSSISQETVQSCVMDIPELIKTAKLGSERKAAQEDTCSAFAAALHDVLSDNGLFPSLIEVSYRGSTVERTWYHQVVEVDGKMYDSLGEFSTDIIRKRLKIHPSVAYPLGYKPDRREGCYDEEELGEVYDFVHLELTKAAKKLGFGKREPTASPKP